jgi:hypothetical protein
MIGAPGGVCQAKVDWGRGQRRSQIFQVSQCPSKSRLKDVKNTQITVDSLSGGDECPSTLLNGRECHDRAPLAFQDAEQGWEEMTNIVRKKPVRAWLRELGLAEI